MVNSVTNNVIGTYDNIIFNQNNLEKYDNVDYQVNCSGITPGDYYLRLVTSVVGEAEYTLADIQNGGFDLAKKNYSEIMFSGETLPVIYKLSQNYPNPFNPSTTIKFQLPTSGVVTLKIYDILGREVTTLVDEFKTEGRYEVVFSAIGGSASGGNASSLASGVYLYRLIVNDYVDVKKMMLLK